MCSSCVKMRLVVVPLTTTSKRDQSSAEFFPQSHIYRLSVLSALPLCNFRFDSILVAVLTKIQGKRVFIKDITYYIVPPEKQESHVAPSLHGIHKRGVGTGEIVDLEVSDFERPTTPQDSAVDLDSPPKSPPFPYETPKEPNNPTVVPRAILERFHFTFLIRHPRFAIPSYYRCCIPPLVERTGFNPFMPCEAGYEELRRLFDYCKDTGLVGPAVCGQDNGMEKEPGQVEICVIDADDLLDDPEGILRQYCESIGLDFRQDMLEWDSEEAHEFAKEQFEKWDGFHDDAIGSKDLKPREHVSFHLCFAICDDL